MAEQLLVVLGILLIVIGTVLAVLALILPVARSGRLQARGGAVIMIGPFPIVFGSDKQTVKTLLVLAIILVSLALGFYLLSRVLLSLG